MSIHDFREEGQVMTAILSLISELPQSLSNSLHPPLNFFIKPYLNHPGCHDSTLTNQRDKRKQHNENRG